MSKKKRRRRPQPGRADRETGRPGRETSVGGRARAGERTVQRGQGRPRTGSEHDGAAARASSPRSRDSREATTTPAVVQPPVAVFLVRGLAVVGRSPALLASIFVGALLLWLAYSSSGVVRVASPGVMAQLESLPPVHSFLDIQFLVTASRVYPASTTIALGAALIVLRTALMAFWLATILEEQGRLQRPRIERAQGEPVSGEPAQSESPEADDRFPSLAPVLRRAAGGFVPMLGVEAGFALLVYGFSVVLGLFLGSLGLIGGFVGSMYFLAYAPVVAIAERATPREAARLASRAARIPGRQHMTFAVLYLLLAILLISTTPTSLAAPSTPSILVWGYVLFVSYLHVSVLAAFAYRWLVLREAVLAGPIATPRPRRLLGSPR